MRTNFDIETQHENHCYVLLKKTTQVACGRAIVADERQEMYHRFALLSQVGVHNPSNYNAQMLILRMQCIACCL